MPIFKRSLLARLMSFLMPGIVDGDGGGGDDQAAAIQAAVDAAVAGLKAKNSELLGKLKTAGDDLKRFDGIDPDAVRTILSKFASDEEAALIAKGEIETVLTKRTERMQADNAKAVKAEKEARERAEAKSSKLSAKALAGLLIEAATGALPEAKDDIIARGSPIWRLNDDGNAVAMNGEEVVFGKDGKTPLSPKEWADSLRETAPHLWPKAQGSGAPGSGAPGRGTGQDLSKLPARERLTAARAQARK